MAETSKPPWIMLKAFAAVRKLRGKEPFPSWPYRVRIGQADLAEKPDLAWNAFVSIVGESSYEELSDIQQVAHLGYWYEAEVYNGGHLQYFRNSSGRYVRQTIAALPRLKADSYARVLSEAYERSRLYPELVDPKRGYSELVRARPFEDIDRAYWECKPEIDELLHRYLDEHLGEFIVFLGET
jgi:hypothetical protein